VGLPIVGSSLLHNPDRWACLLAGFKL